MTNAATSPGELRGEAMDFDLIAFDRNDGYLTRAAELLRQAADEIERLQANQRTGRIVHGDAE